MFTIRPEFDMVNENQINTYKKVKSYFNNSKRKPV